MLTKYKILLLVFPLVFVLDQVTKYQAVAQLTHAFERADRQTFGERLSGFLTLRNLDNDPPAPDGVDQRRAPATVVPRFWANKYVENPGAAWGLLSGLSDRVRVPFFHVVSLAAVAFILSFLRRVEPGQRFLSFALSLVLGGAFGNYLDRLMRGYVIDFIEWSWPWNPALRWPTFNVADSAICVGVVMLLIESFLPQTSPTAAAAEPLASPASPAAPPEPEPDRS